MNPYIAIGGLVAAVAISAGGFHVGRNYEKGQQADDKQLIADAAQAFDGKVAAHVGTIRPIHKTIQSTAKETIREVPIYAECIHDPAVVSLLDAARANRSAGEREASLPAGPGPGSP
jgi:hypothetical protein